MSHSRHVTSLKEGEDSISTVAPAAIFIGSSGQTFIQLGFNLSNRVTDTLESSTILIYLILVKLIKRNTKEGIFLINKKMFFLFER